MKLGSCISIGEHNTEARGSPPLTRQGQCGDAHSSTCSAGQGVTRVITN